MLKKNRRVTLPSFFLFAASLTNRANVDKPRDSNVTAARSLIGRGGDVTVAEEQSRVQSIKRPGVSLTFNLISKAINTFIYFKTC